MKNEKALEPNEYFHGLKDKIQKTDLATIEEDIKMVTNLIEEAKEIGQNALAKNYEDLAITYFKERVIFKHGYSKYVKKDDIEKYIRNVKDQVVKICELELFPRTLPKEVSDKIKELKKLKIFDDMWVVFIDYEQKENLTKEEKEMRSKNRDPILFATFEECMDRFYFIADWDDDICDLRFEDMVTELKKLDKKYAVKEIIKDGEKYMQELIKERNHKPVKLSDKIKATWKSLLDIWKE